MKCLLDNNLPPSLAKALDALSIHQFSDLEQVIALREKFPSDTADIAWIQALGQEGDWFVLSADKFRKNGDLERKALRQSKLIVFCLSKQWSDQPYWENPRICCVGGRILWSKLNAFRAVLHFGSLGG